MKIRADFVTNSSTTAFVVITSEDFTLDVLCDLMGVRGRSPLRSLFAGLFESLRGEMLSPRERYDRYVRSKRERPADEDGKLLDYRGYLTEEFSGQLAKRIEVAETKGKQVFMGRLGSEYGDTECFFCCDAFEAENDVAFLSALKCYW